MWGFILGGLTWFAIPFSLATTMGLAYLGMSSAQGAPLLTDADVSSGLAAPLVAQKLLGTTGEYAMLFLILMAVMSTGSAEVIAVASIIIYDIYQVRFHEFFQDFTRFFNVCLKRVLLSHERPWVIEQFIQVVSDCSLLG